MDVLRPPLVWIDGRCYRRYVTDCHQLIHNPQEEEFDDRSRRNLFAQDNNPVLEKIELDECDLPYKIEETGNHRFQTKFHVANSYFGNIIGTKGATKKRIENETKTQIIVPGHGHTGDIVIKGGDRKSVFSARTRIELLVRSSRRRQPFTHFLSIPLGGPAVKKGFLKFKEKILEQFKQDRGVDESLFQSPEKLHLTIGTLVLMDKYERTECVKVLQECASGLISSIIGKDPLVLTVKGLEIMNDDPSEVDVLYANVQPKDGSQRLQQFADSLMLKFANAELIDKQYDKVKIHATVMNSLFRKSGSVVCDNEIGSHRSNSRARETFNAGNIVEECGGFYFGDCTVSEIHLSERFTTDKETGYYACTSKIDISSVS